jgi:ADP-heptose:LPS heptosyltransferase
MGDIILTQPDIAVVTKKSYRVAFRDYLCKESFSELPESLILCKSYCLSKTLKFHLWLFKSKYDIVIDLHNKFATYLIMLFIKASQKVHYCKKRKFRQRIVKGDKKLKIDSTVSLYASALTKLGIKQPWSYPRLQIRVGAIKFLISYKSRLQRYQTIKIVFSWANHFTNGIQFFSWIQLII